LVTVEGLAVRADATDSGQSLALDFMRFVTDLPSQTALMAEANKIPTHGSVSTLDDPYLSVFFEQAQTGHLLPATDQAQTVLEFGPEAYRAVLQEGRDATEAVREVVAAINAANGIVVTPTPTPAPTLAPTAAPVEEAESAPTPSENDGGGGRGDEVIAE
jgi:maltose-binding protein MalE